MTIVVWVLVVLVVVVPRICHKVIVLSHSVVLGSVSSSVVARVPSRWLGSCLFLVLAILVPIVVAHLTNLACR